MTPCLNWREFELLVQTLSPQVVGLFVDRIIVPERPKFPAGYLKGEWVIRLTGRKNEGVLLMSIRPRHPYFAWQQGKGPKASPQATHSPFDLAISKYLKGSRLQEVSTLPQERIVILWFSGHEERLGLILVFIPAAPEAFLVSESKTHPNPRDLPQDLKEEGWAIIAQSRVQTRKIRDDGKARTRYFRPQNSHLAPASPPVRQELIENTGALYQAIEKELSREAFSLRAQTAEKTLKTQLKQAQERLRQSQTSHREAEKEENWQLYGDLLKATLGQNMESPPMSRMPPLCMDPRLSPQAQVAKFYQNARRKQRRLTEAQSRIERFQLLVGRLEKVLQHQLIEADWAELGQLEALSGTSPPVHSQDISPHPGAQKKNKKTNFAIWTGKSFLSKEGLPIWVGRNREENLELTFKLARGNDLWMHVRGRPGAHVVIPLHSGKSAALDTLLDGATLAIYYSGGAHWGKTEVDYTFKKYVKRMKDSSEVSYTHNKTLLMEPDLNRRNRLLSQNPT